MSVDFAAARQDDPRFVWGRLRDIEYVPCSLDVGLPAQFGVLLSPNDSGNRSKVNDADAVPCGDPEGAQVEDILVVSSQIEAPNVQSQRG